MKSEQHLNFEDLMQVVVGSSALAVPVAFSEESWRLSYTLPLPNIVFLCLLSLMFINLYSYQSIFQGKIERRVSTFVFRTVFVYAITGIVVAGILFGLNRLPLFTEPVVAIKRILILSFPASMGAVVVDSFDKE